MTHLGQHHVLLTPGHHGPASLSSSLVARLGSPFDESVLVGDGANAPGGAHPTGGGGGNGRQGDAAPTAAPWSAAKSAVTAPTSNASTTSGPMTWKET
jgi:hypothetical protein